MHEMGSSFGACCFAFVVLSLYNTHLWPVLLPPRKSRVVVVSIPFSIFCTRQGLKQEGCGSFDLFKGIFSEIKG